MTASEGESAKDTPQSGGEATPSTEPPTPQGSPFETPVMEEIERDYDAPHKETRDA